jgi:hypothetical protein
MGINTGSIIAAIMTTHIPRNDTAAPGHDWPGIGIHIMDMLASMTAQRLPYSS